jgi:uncharacterized protein YdhG (YjbR/CyaY superfamily)
MKKEITNVDEYLEGFPEGVREKLNSIRRTILENAPGAFEGIAYRMPAYRTNGKPLVYFAGFDRHIGFYATPAGHERFRDELSVYKQGKGSVQFPIDRPVPLSLIAAIVRFRVNENGQ